MHHHKDVHTNWTCDVENFVPIQFFATNWGTLTECDASPRRYGVNYIKRFKYLPY